MESLSAGRGEGRVIDWSHPMNTSHLPPKSPGYSMFGGSSLFEGGGLFNVHSSFPSRGSSHKRTPSAGYLPQVQPPWLEEILEPSDGDIDATVKKGSHRRSSSDSATFQESPYQFKCIAGQSTAEEEYTGGAPGARMLRGVIPDYSSCANRLDEEQLISVLAKMEPIQRQPKQGAEGTVVSRATVTNAVRPSVSGDNWTLDRVTKHLLRNSPHGSSNNTVVWENLRKQKPTNVNAESFSDSNSHSEGSNDEQRVSLGKYKSEAQVQSTREGDCSHQGQQEGTQASYEQIDLDPKKAKRILANRQSAQRSRVRKLQYISELETSVNALQAEVTSLSQQLGLYDHRRAMMTAENLILKQKLAALQHTQWFKEAHNGALKKEVERLSYQHQQQLPSLSPPGFDIPQKQVNQWDLGPQQQHPPLSATGYDLVKQRFSKLDLCVQQQQQQQQQQLPPLSPTGYELLKQQFSKLDLGAQQQQQQQQLPPLSPTGYELQRQRFSKVDLGSQQQQLSPLSPIP